MDRPVQKKQSFSANKQSFSANRIIFYSFTIAVFVLLFLVVSPKNAQAVVPAPPYPHGCQADYDGNGTIDSADAAILGGIAFGKRYFVR